MRKVSVYLGEQLGRYGFPEGHPFSPNRMHAFWQEAQRQGLDERVQVRPPRCATRAELERFHTPEYVDRVQHLSERGSGLLDHGDTPAFAGCYEAAAAVVGSALDALREVMEGGAQRAFLPIGGLHHARRDRAGGFCIFNDCGVVIETLRLEYGVQRLAYVDIDAHHGDGVFYEFESDPELFFVDLHEDGRFLYPGTGSADETGRGPAKGCKLNLPLLPGANDQVFARKWPDAEAFLEQAQPEVILLQCGADSIDGDPLTHMRYTPAVHARAARALCELADRHAGGRLLAAGGGGYNLDNLGAAWTAVLEQLLQ